MSHDKPRVQVESRPEGGAWLAANHDRSDGIWLVTYNKIQADKYLSTDDIVEEAICFGWIDSLPRKLDDERSRRYLASRQPGSGWSRVSKQQVARMHKACLMNPAGQAKIDAAKADSSWNPLDAVENLEIPGDLAAAFGRYAGSRDHFEVFPRSVECGILAWTLTAKREATCAKRVVETARLAQDNIRTNQWSQK